MSHKKLGIPLLFEPLLREGRKRNNSSNASVRGDTGAVPYPLLSGTRKKSAVEKRPLRREKKKKKRGEKIAFTQER